MLIRMCGSNDILTTVNNSIKCIALDKVSLHFSKGGQKGNQSIIDIPISKVIIGLFILNIY